MHVESPNMNKTAADIPLKLAINETIVKPSLWKKTRMNENTFFRIVTEKA